VAGLLEARPVTVSALGTQPPCNPTTPMQSKRMLSFAKAKGHYAVKVTPCNPNYPMQSREGVPILPVRNVRETGMWEFWELLRVCF
jgi:hypothetical protein